MLYNIFVNDLLYEINDDFYNYADNNTIAVIGDEVSYVLNKLQQNAKICIDWFASNMMRANPEKFQLMVLNRKCNNNLQTSLVVGDTTIKSVNEVKLLGITIDTKLSFDSHVNILCKKGSRNMNILKRFPIELSV